MRILRVISSLNPTNGGPVAALKAITPILAEMGCETEVVCLDERNASFLSEFPAAVHAIGKAKTSYQWSPELKPWLQRNLPRFDAAVVHGLWQYPGLCTRAACRNVGKKYFVYTHGMLDPWFKRHYPLKHLKKWLYWPLGEYRVLRDAAAVLFTTDEERRLARKSFWLYRCHEQVVSYGTSAPPSAPELQRKNFLGEFPLLKGRAFLLFLGRIHEKKGCDLLIEAYAKWGMEAHPQSGACPAVVMAGPCADSAYLERLKTLAKERGLEVTNWDSGLRMSDEMATGVPRIHFLPMLSGEIKWGAFRCAQAFVLPSHQENFGVAVAEALACGTPVLISNKVNIWREIEADEAGLVEDDTVEGCVELFRRWERASGAASLMRKRARQCFETRFEISAAADSLLRCLESNLSDQALIDTR